MIKLVANGGNVAQTFAGVISDGKTVLNSNAPTAQRVIAGVSIASEALPISVGDAKDGIRIAKEIKLSVAKHGEAAEHARDAIATGQPNVLTIDRAGAATNRAEAIGGLDKVPDKQLDEYPPAMFAEGGAGASVRAIDPSDNMSAGACIGNSCRGLADGEKIRIVVDE